MTDPEYARKISSATFDPLKGKHPPLGMLDIELTERCNNRCIHCLINRPEHDTGAKEREMDTAFVLDLLRQAAALGCMTVRFTGGEPLLRPDFAELYLAARRLGMKVILFTNGRLITPDLAALLARVPPGEVVEVTVYGMHPESYDAVAGVKGSFQEFRRGVGLLLEQNVRFIVKGALLPQNRHEMAELAAWAATIPAMDYMPAYSMNFDLRARRDDPQKNRRIAALRLSPEETTALLAENPGYVSGMQEFCKRFMHPPGDRLFSCGSGHGTCVDAYGTAQMCLPLRHPETVCDLRKHSLEEVITKIFPVFRERKAENPEYLRRCARCFLKGLCEQCPAKSWMEHGTLDTPVEYLCDVAHAQARYLGLIGEHEKAWDVVNWQDRIHQFTHKTA
ncbi:MAG TPA: radical SAM protein [Methanoregulaceae archaeon]|nr:radical SAM protein [Methanoregulaceae archaeon]